MTKENERLLSMLQQGKISEEEYKSLVAVLDKDESLLSRLFSVAINPFQKIAGWYSLAAGVIVLIAMSFIGAIAQIYFTGLLGILNSAIIKNPTVKSSFMLLAYQNSVVWVTLTILFIISAKICQQKRLRIIDFFGTVALSRIPFLVLTIFLCVIQIVNPGFMNNFDLTKEHQFHPSFGITLFMIFVLACGIWQLITYFYALKESSGLMGKKLWTSFIASLILGEAISSALTNVFF